MRTITRNAAWGHCIVPRQGIPKYLVRHAGPWGSNVHRTEKVAVRPLQARGRRLVLSSVIASGRVDLELLHLAVDCEQGHIVFDPYPGRHGMNDKIAERTERNPWQISNEPR
jgi:hypothetical protein